MRVEPARGVECSCFNLVKELNDNKQVLIAVEINIFTFITVPF